MGNNGFLFLTISIIFFIFFSFLFHSLLHIIFVPRIHVLCVARFFFCWSQLRMPAFDILSNGSSYGKEMRRKIFLLYAFHFSPFIFITIFFWIFLFSSYDDVDDDDMENCVVGSEICVYILSFLYHFRQKKILSPSLYVWQWHFRQLNLFSFSFCFFFSYYDDFSFSFSPPFWFFFISTFIFY